MLLDWLSGKKTLAKLARSPAKRRKLEKTLREAVSAMKTELEGLRAFRDSVSDLAFKADQQEWPTRSRVLKFDKVKRG